METALRLSVCFDLLIQNNYILTCGNVNLEMGKCDMN